MTDEQLDEILAQLPFMEAWVAAIKEETVKRIEAGVEFKNAKMVPGRTTRGWSDEAEALAWLRKSFPLKVVAPRKVLSVAQAEKVVGRGKMPSGLVDAKRSADRLVIGN